MRSRIVSHLYSSRKAVAPRNPEGVFLPLKDGRILLACCCEGQGKCCLQGLYIRKIHPC